MIHIALFRGINVGGKNILPMKDLRTLLEQFGAQSVKTYIQSGNAVFTSEDENAARWTHRIRAAVTQAHGFEPTVILLSGSALDQSISSNPFPEAEAEPKRLHLGFLEKTPASANLDKLEHLRTGRERYQLTGNCFYLHAPDGIGRSKLAAGAEKAIGVPMTVRNWNTVVKLQKLATPE